MTIQCLVAFVVLNWNIEYMGFFALKQHSEKENHRKLAEIASKPEVQSVLQGFFPKESNFAKVWYYSKLITEFQWR